MRISDWSSDVCSSDLIINVVSANAKAPKGESAPTTLSRSAGLTLTKVMSQELAQWNILVNALCVGVIKSGQRERRHAQQAPDTDYDAFLKPRSEEHTSELQSLMRISYAVFCLKKKKYTEITNKYNTIQIIKDIT